MSTFHRQFISIVLSLCIYTTLSTILFSETTLIENDTIQITINTELNSVHIHLTTSVSAPLKWRGFGFGSSQMVDTYGIIIDYTFPTQQPIVYETTLGEHNIGTLYTESEIIVISDTNDGITRRINLQRSISGTYSFPSTARTIDIVSAIGQRSNFPQCVGHRQSNCQHAPLTGRHTGSLLFNALPTVTPSHHPSLHPTNGPTNLPSIDPTSTPTIKPSVNPSVSPTAVSTLQPTMDPTTNTQSMNPTISPTLYPTITPIQFPTLTLPPFPIAAVTKKRTNDPSLHPSIKPTVDPTMPPTSYPTYGPSQLQLYITETTIINRPSTSVRDADIICDDGEECKGDIICSEGDCHIVCNSDDSCKWSNIYGINAQSLSVECNGIHSCTQATMFGGNVLFVVVRCIGFESCKGSTFYGNNTHLLSIHCLNENGSCQDMKVYCPSNGKQCVISNDGIDSNDIHTNLEFYAAHGFDDLDVSKYKATLMDTNNSTTNMMHCGADYQSFCSLNASLLCHCHYQSIVIKINYAEMAGFIAVLCVVLVLGLAFIGLCMFLVRSLWNANQKTKTTRYKSVNIEYGQTHNIEIKSIHPYRGNLQSIQEEDTDDTDESDCDKTHLYSLDTDKRAAQSYAK